MSQSELAEALKIGLRSYQRYESGESIPSIDLIFLLSKVLKFELKEMFSSEDQKAQLQNFKIFPGDQKNEFLTDSMVLNSQLHRIYLSPEFQKVIETGDIKAIKENEIFMNSPFNLAVSQPKHSIINITTQKTTGLNADQVLTSAGHDDVKKLGLSWALFMDSEECYFQDITHPVFPKGKSTMMTKGIYSGKNHNYVILSLCDIEIAPKKAR